MEKKEKKNRQASVVLPDRIAETIYNPKSQETLFAVYENDEVGLADFVKTDKETIYPLDGKNDIVRKGIVLLPSDTAEYGSEEALVHDIHTFIHKYLDISEQFEHIASYYVLFSWIFDRFNEVPYLRAIGDFGSGKSRFLRVIGSLCYRPIFTGGATTTAPIFRILEEMRGTLVLDEADLKASDMTNELIKILNMGYERGGSVLRMQGKNMDVIKSYDVFSPKVVATRETFNDKALESRFLVEEMGKGTLRDDIPRRLDDSFYGAALELRNKLLLWRFRNYRKPIDFDEKPIAGIHPRLHQIIIPLLSIIQSEEVKRSLVEFMKRYNEELVADRGLSWESDILFATLKVAYETKQDTLTVKQITDQANLEIDVNEDPFKPRKVGWILRQKLQLKTYKTRNGYTLSMSKNAEKINFLRERYGITDTDIRGEDANNVNDVNVLKGPEGLPFNTV